MVFTDFSSLFHIFSAAILLIIAILVIGRRGLGDNVSRLLVSLSVVSFLGEVVRSDPTYIYFNSGLPESMILHLPYYLVGLFAFLSASLTHVFLQNEPVNKRLWLLATLWLSIIIVLDINWLNLPETIWQNPAVLIDKQLITFTGLVLGWGICMVWSMRVTATCYLNAERIVVKHQVIYWAFSVLLIFGSGLSFLLLNDILSSILNIIGMIAAYYIITLHHIPELNQVLRRVFGILLVGLFTLEIYAVVFWAIQSYFPDFVDYSPILAGFALALILVVLFNPLIHQLRIWLNKIISGPPVDPNEIFREYSQGINNVLDLAKLSSTAIELIRETLDIEGGVLFSVDSEYGEDGEQYYHLMGFPSEERRSPITVRLPVESPLAAELGDMRRPLTRAEIDVVPKFRNLTTQERSWLRSIDMDVCIPIHFKEEWVGVFALGPKRTGAAFFEEDIALLTILANQTAVALQNARLMASLVRINNEFQRAYSSMEDAHTKLEKIDQTKSDFISIASHELRTPLTVLSGYSQMLMDDPAFKDDYYSKIIGGIHDSSTRLHEIVDSMLDIARIDAHILELQAENVKLEEVLEEICRENSKVIKKRSLTVEFQNMTELSPVQGDPESLKKVFYHLIMNAIKFTPDGGKISISGREISEGEDQFPPGGIEIIISDTGIGIDPRYIDLIFTRFYQTGELAFHSSSKSKFKGGGPGLGLAIVRGIIEAHNGRVWAESPGYDEALQPGSQFHVILPRKAEIRIIPAGEINV